MNWLKSFFIRKYYCPYCGKYLTWSWKWANKSIPPCTCKIYFNDNGVLTIDAL